MGVFDQLDSTFDQAVSSANWAIDKTLNAAYTVTGVAAAGLAPAITAAVQTPFVAASLPFRALGIGPKMTISQQLGLDKK